MPMKKPRTKKRAHSSTSARRQAAAPRPRKTERKTSLLEWLQRDILFSNVDTKILSRIAPRLSLQTIKAGEMIFDESSRGREL